jgi:ubiquinone biosynthesis protein
MKKMRVEMMELAFRYRLRIPAYLTSLMKAMITVEGVGKQLDPTFDFKEVVTPLALKVYQERLKPENVSRYLRNRFYQDIKPLAEIPANLNRVLKRTGEGRMIINFQMDLSPKMNRKITQLINRLGLSMIATGAVIASALIIQTNHTQTIAEFAYLGVIGFAVAIIIMLAFFFGSLR